jgi:large subunit ribosomal protein L37Ae|tara:strand:+ start:340 stop:732 length:393 start_codon:yes stop_codon:yes gene_type:complete
MVEKKKKSSTKRFGPRYGRKLKEKVADIEAGHRGRHKCPYCGKNGIKRLSIGIWFCRLCKVKFASKAYSIDSKMITKDVEEEPSKKDKENSEKSKDAETDVHETQEVSESKKILEPKEITKKEGEEDGKV